MEFFGGVRSLFQKKKFSKKQEKGIKSELVHKMYVNVPLLWQKKNYVNLCTFIR